MLREEFINYIKYISPIEWVARIVMERIGILEILPASLLIEKLSWDLIGHLCLKLQLRGTPKLKDKDAKMLDKICHHARTSKTSFLTILHYGQNIVNKCFHAYDWYDAGENMRRYGSSSAPVYRLSDVQVPVAMFWSPRDSLSSRQDMETLVTYDGRGRCSEVMVRCGDQTGDRHRARVRRWAGRIRWEVTDDKSEYIVIQRR